MSEGAGDRPGLLVAFQASGDRPSPVSAVRADLVGLNGKRVAVVTMILGAEAPECVMYLGDPYLAVCDASNPGLTYRQTRPYRADLMVSDEAFR